MAFANAFRSILLLSALGLAAPSAQAQQVEGVAAVVNDEPITTLDVRDRMRLIIFSAGVQPSEEVLVQVQEQAIRGLVEESLQIQTAQDFDLIVDDEEVDEALGEMAARNNTTVSEIQNELAGAGIGIETLRRQIRAEITWQYMVSGRFNSRIRVSDAQIATTLARIAESAAEAQYRIGEIYVALPATGSEQAAEQRIETIYSQLSQGAPFPAVAQQFSDAPTAASGGDAGWLTAEQIRPQVAQSVRQMQPGQISNPIRVSGGYMIVALIDARDGQVSEQFTLQQITVPASRVTDSTRDQLERARGRIQGCQNLSSATEGVEGAVTTDLGSIAAGGLIAQIREALAGVEAGQASEVVETAAGLQIFVVCDREMAGAGIPSRQQVESELRNQQLNLAARRWLRDLRSNATIEIR